MNNSMFTTEPPSIILAPATPKEIEDAKIREFLDEEKIANGFIDFEAVRFRELINNGKSERNW